MNIIHDLHSPGVLQRWVDRILFFLCCVIVAARAQINEAFPVGWRVTGPLPEVDIATGEIPAMLIFSALIVTAAVVWIVVRLAHGCLVWKKTSLGIPFILIVIASVLSTVAASNRHTALIHSIVLTAHMVLAMLLVQLLDRPSRQWILICVIIACGVTLAYRCWEQVSYEHPLMEKQYAANPNQALAAQGIEPDTYAARKFAARIASRDVGGFFPISNIAAAFLILSSFAGLAVIALLLHQTPKPWAWLILAAALEAVQFWALWITQSKGGIASFVAAIGLLALLSRLHRRLHRHWRKLLLLSLVLLFLGVGGLIGYGVTHGRLPTASMWVRWQYWTASSAMIADHPLTGVGAGNFGAYYPRYMDLAAPEVISDPHCLPLALSSQWGVLALIGLVWAIVAAACRFTRPSTFPDESHQETNPGGRGVLWALLCAIGVLCCRWAVGGPGPGLTTVQWVSIVIISLVIPFIVWFGAFLIVFKAIHGRSPTAKKDRLQKVSLLISSCALVGFLLHNCIDFAFFVPGVGSCFFAMLALALAGSQSKLEKPVVTVSPGLIGSLLIGVIGFALVLVAWLGGVFPFYRSYNSLKDAERCMLIAENFSKAFERGYVKSSTTSEQNRAYQKALVAAERAGRLNPLDPDGPFLLGKIRFVLWLRYAQQHLKQFQEAVDAIEQAHRRDRAHYRYDRQLSDMYRYALLNQPDHAEYLGKAVSHLDHVLQCYPGKPELLVEYADLLGRQKHYQQAVQSLEKALGIEEDFLKMQSEMFPESAERVYRLTPDQMNRVREHIKDLKKQLKPGTNNGSDL